MRERDIYLDAVEIEDPVALTAFLDSACNGDPLLRAKVEGLLKSNANAGNFLDVPLVRQSSMETEHIRPERTPNLFPPSQPDRNAPEIGSVIANRYTLVDVIGEGGMGTVYCARQTTPVKRDVALKLIRPGMDSRSVMKRFEAERQALALMDHPNIARVYDGGTTDSGRPYFVMELVDGISITRFCDDHRLSVKSRLELFISVCMAVQHAHQKGVIHRDLKPGNILVAEVDGRPVAKVIDFGLAKAIEQRLTDESIAETQVIIGTPDYMSPEQADPGAMDIDTRTDVYALGAILYELLTGAPPLGGHDESKFSLWEKLQRVRDTEPPRPSAKCVGRVEHAVIAANRQLEPGSLRRLLQKDLDWIPLKALEKDRTRRYETASELAADLQRYLDDQPVLARPSSTWYRFGKLIRRNKAASIASAVVALSLVGGLAVSIWQTLQTERAARRVMAVLEELRATAPAFAEQARGLVLEGRFQEALEKLAYASKLCPEVPDYHIARGDLLQCELRLEEAAAAYRNALRLQPGDTRASSSAALCDDLLASPRGDDGQLSAASIGKLYRAIQQQQRPLAELMPLARRLDSERDHIVAYWLSRLAAVPFYLNAPNKNFLTLRHDGLLNVDLKSSGVTDLAPLIGMPIGSFDLTGCDQITDFTPLGRFPDLRSLRLSGTKIDDLSPLTGLPLESLVLSDTQRSQAVLGIDKGKLALTTLGTRVTNLEPLAGMPLTEFHADSIMTADFSPLAGAPLRSCVIQSPKLRDLSFLKNAPLKELSLYGCTDARGFAVLAELPQLEQLILPQNLHLIDDDEAAALELLRGHPRLKRIDFQGNHQYPHLPERTVSEFWRDWENLTWMRRLYAANLEKVDLRLLPNQTWYLRADATSLSDLSILRGAKISDLNIGYTEIADLTPLRGMPLEALQIPFTKVTDVSPLAGMPIQKLNMQAIKIKDIAVVRNMPLRTIRLENCNGLTDLSPLHGMKTLEEATLPPGARDIEFLRTLPRMRRLGFRQNARYSPELTSAEFWKQWDAAQKQAGNAVENP
jgi:serine/threonine protein kinase/Leucine-rich repeat (LRR) protein